MEFKFHLVHVGLSFYHKRTNGQNWLILYDFTWHQLTTHLSTGQDMALQKQYGYFKIGCLLLNGLRGVCRFVFFAWFRPADLCDLFSHILFIKTQSWLIQFFVSCPVEWKAGHDYHWRYNFNAQRCVVNWCHVKSYSINFFWANQRHFNALKALLIWEGNRCEVFFNRRGNKKGGRFRHGHDKKRMPCISRLSRMSKK